jgi:hypothetical protein
MFPINDYAVFQRRQAELLKKAEIEQLLLQAKSERSQSLPRRGASWMGVRLVKLGQQLERFGTPDRRRSAASISAHSSSL